MKPILFSPVETAFETNGIGVLSDAISCRPVHELNGKYELEIKYPITGLHFADIQQRSTFLAKVDPVSALQPFRAYQITKPSNNVVTVRARHIAYDLAGIPVSPFTANSVGAALSGLSLNAAVDCPFTFSTDKGSETDFAVKVPTPIWSLLGGSKGSLLDTYGGEYVFDRYDVKLLNHLGTDRGVSIRYGKNLTSLEQDENCANCYTGIYPYWINTEGNLVELPEKVVKAPGTYNYEKVKPVDFTAEWQEAPTEEQLRARAEKYVTDNDIGKPLVSWKIEFVQLEQTKEYKGKALLERVLLGDTVLVEFPEMGISTTARVVAVEYDSILERYISVTLGSVKANIASTIVEQNNQISSKPSHSEMQTTVKLLTSLILGATGGAVRLLDDNGDGFPDTLYIADNPDPAQAVKVWRFNYEGWGASKNGYNGPFIMGATLDSGFVADFIATGILDASLLKTGLIQSKDGTLMIDLDGENGFVCSSATKEKCEIKNGEIRLYDKTGLLRLSVVRLLNDFWTDYRVMFHAEDGSEIGGIGAIWDEFYIFAKDSSTGGLKGLKAKWKENDDETHTLIGE